MYRIIMCAAAGAFCISNSAKADETLKWRVAQHPATNQTQQVSDVNGHILSLYRLPGIVFFSDGSTGASQVFGTADTVNGAGTSDGYQLITFSDSSELWMKWTGRLEGAKRSGTFAVIGGKGRYTGAKGDGTWEAHGTPIVGANSDTNSISYVDIVANIKK
jgi:hypothetical protein